jgi:hypothetical protein
MGKRYDKLAKHLVNIDGAFKNEEEAIALMKERAKKIILTEEQPAVKVMVDIDTRKIAKARVS